MRPWVSQLKGLSHP